MGYSNFDHRLRDLADNIAKDQELLKEYQDVLRYEDDPRKMAKYRREIQRQKESVENYQQEYAQLEKEDKGKYSPEMQLVGKQLQQMDEKLDLLLHSQVAIYQDINQMRQTLLNRYDATEQILIEAMTQQFDRQQILLTQTLLDALENDVLSESDMQQMLAVLAERIPALPAKEAAIAEIIKSPELDAKHKLRVTLPLVPFLVDYEAELELGTGFNIQSAWEKILEKLRSGKP